MHFIKKLALATAVIASASAAFAEKPKETQGLDVTPLELHEAIGEQISVMDGFALRARRIVIEPGGTIAEHSHADRPGVVYILEGSMTEHRGDVARVVKPGDTWTEMADTVHWMENTSGKPCTIIAVDLVANK